MHAKKGVKGLFAPKDLSLAGHVHFCVAADRSVMQYKKKNVKELQKIVKN